MTDDIAGKAFVEQFGLDTFARAENAVKADKASRQTADTYQASATFLELLAIWGALEPEITQKIKYAKFHALRIAKALRAGEDPNLSNPKPEPKPEEIVPPLDPNDPEVQMLNGSPKDRQPSVVDVPDETDSLQAKLARQSSLNESIHPSRAPSAPPPQETSNQPSAGVSPLPKDAAAFYGTNQRDISPVSPDRQSSVGGNYFPRMPSPTSTQAQPDIPPTLPSAPDTLDDSGPAFDLPSAPADIGDEPSLPAAPTTFAHPQPMVPRTPLDSFQAPPTPGQPPIASIPPNLPQAPPQQPYMRDQPSIPQQLQQPSPDLFSVPTVSSSNITQTSAAVPAPAPSQPVYIPPPQALPNPNVVVDEEAMMKAQKHARWAISALNFEDVPTAIKEFQLALQTLGAR